MVALVVAFAVNGAYAQAATTEPAGKPLGLLAGLRPPHETKHKHLRHIVHAVSHAKAAHEKAARTRHARTATVHSGRPAKRLAKREYEHRGRRYEHHEQPVTASAFAEEPPPRAVPNATPGSLTPASSQPVVNAGQVDGGTAQAAEPAVAPPSQDAAPNVDANAGPAAARIETVKVTPSDEGAGSDPPAVSRPAAANVASAAMAPSDDVAAAPPSQSVVTAPAQQPQHKDPVGSASWIAQVLAALGGAVTAGAVAWFLIGGGPARTYG